MFFLLILSTVRRTALMTTCMIIIDYMSANFVVITADLIKHYNNTLQQTKKKQSNWAVSNKNPNILHYWKVQKIKMLIWDILNTVSHFFTINIYYDILTMTRVCNFQS